MAGWPWPLASWVALVAGAEPDGRDRRCEDATLTRCSELDLQGDGGGRRGARAAGDRLEAQGAAVQAGEVHRKEAKEGEQQHGDDPLTGGRG